MIDWDKPDEPDAIKPQGMVKVGTLGDALKLLDQWEEAYAELRRDYHQLHSKYIDVKFIAECNRTLADNYELLWERRADYPE